MSIDLARAGAALREVRELARLKQREVAELLGVSDGAVSQWESGKTELRPSQLQELAAFVGLDFDALLFRMGYRVTEDAQKRWVDWLLSRYNAETPSAPVSKQKPWAGIGRTKRANVPQQGDDESSAVRYRDWSSSVELARSQSALVPA